MMEQWNALKYDSGLTLINKISWMLSVWMVPCTLSLPPLVKPALTWAFRRQHLTDLFCFWQWHDHRKARLWDVWHLAPLRKTAAQCCQFTLTICSVIVLLVFHTSLCTMHSLLDKRLVSKMLQYFEIILKVYEVMTEVLLCVSRLLLQ